jgi:hypothetical protein
VGFVRSGVDLDSTVHFGSLSMSLFFFSNWRVLARGCFAMLVDWSSLGYLASVCFSDCISCCVQLV